MSEQTIDKELEAIRVVFEAVKGLDPSVRNRVFAWVRDRLGDSYPTVITYPTYSVPYPSNPIINPITNPWVTYTISDSSPKKERDQ